MLNVENEGSKVFSLETREFTDMEILEMPY